MMRKTPGVSTLIAGFDSSSARDRLERGMVVETPGVGRATQPGRRSIRRGFSIAEAVIATTTLAVLAGMGISVICLLMTAEQQTAESVVVESTIAHLADELRRDAHAATAADREQPAALSLQLPDDVQVSYACTDDGVWRRESKQDESIRQEKFHLPFGSSWFDPVEEGRIVVWRHEREVPVTMSIAEPSALTDQPRSAYRIEAALNIHPNPTNNDRLRLSTTPEQPSAE